MLRYLWLCLALFGSLGPTNFASARTLSLSPRSHWLLEKSEDRCVMSRQFGTDDRTIFTQFARYGPSDDFAFNLIGRPFGNLYQRQPVSLRFGTDGKFVAHGAMIGDFKDLPMLFLSGRLDNLDISRWHREHPDEAPPAITPNQEAAVTSMEVQFSGLALHLELGSLAKPMFALRKCTDELLQSWGLDPLEQASLVQHVTPLERPTTWLHPKDFPPASERAGKQAVLSFRLMVAADGNPTACSIQERAQADPAISQATCSALMKRARFKPARRADGTPVASYFIDSVNWVQL